MEGASSHKRAIESDSNMVTHRKAVEGRVGSFGRRSLGLLVLGCSLTLELVHGYTFPLAHKLPSSRTNSLSQVTCVVKVRGCESR
jgi:hypothetical protein